MPPILFKRHFASDMDRYKRKTERKLQFKEEMFTEIKQKLTEGYSKRALVDEYGIHEATLRKRLNNNSIPTSLGRYKPAFSTEMENQLADHIKKLDSLFYGITLKQLQIIAFQYAEENKLEHRFSKEKGMVGKEWTILFCQRHSLSVRQPEQTSLARIIGFNKVQVDRFFLNLRNMLETYHFLPNSIFNMDETSVLTVPTKIPKVISPRGKRTVGKIVSGERGQLITAVCCVSAGGNYVPPALIFPRKRQKIELLNGAPPQSILMVSDSGFINSELFVEWLKHFQKHVSASLEQPVLLILDNHSTHISLPAVLFCRASGIHMLSLPPHASHKLQPLDVAVFGPLKTAYAKEADNWLVSHPGRTITQYQVAGLFGNAYNRIASIDKACKAFSATGIWPFNCDVFTEENFAPSGVTNKEYNDKTNIEQINNDAQSTSTATGSIVQVNSDDIGLQTNDPTVVTENVEIELESENILEELLAVPSTSGDNSVRVLAFVPPEKICPTPKATVNKRKRAGKKSEILTNSPYKNGLLEKHPKNKPKVITKSKAKRGVTKKLKFDNAKDKDDGICYGCGEIYGTPPEFDLIQCYSCKAWWHEICTAYTGSGPFICDFCEQNK